VAAVFLVVHPVHSGFDGTRPSSATSLDENGTWVLIPILLPVLVALISVVSPRRAVRVAAVVLLGAFVAVAGFSIGLFYLPAAVAMIVAARARGGQSVSLTPVATAVQWSYSLLRTSSGVQGVTCEFQGRSADRGATPGRPTTST
jgi:hypothetical protein